MEDRTLNTSLLDLTLLSLAYGGDAIGRIPASVPGQPDRVVFVPFGIPGERVRVRFVEQHRGFARAELVEVLEPSLERNTPRCKHFGVCGGCHYQHMSYELQLKAKTDILRDQLRRIGHLKHPPVREAVPSPQPWYYRNHVQFHLTHNGRLGYVAAPIRLPERASEQPIDPFSDPSILPITECHLPEAAINALWPQLEFEPGSEIERVVIRQGTDSGLVVALESDAPELPELDTDAGISVVHIFEEHAVVLAGGEHLTIRVLGRDFRVSAPSFFQVNTALAERMVEHILTNLPAYEPPDLPISQSTILDVYCGAGLFSAFLAPRCGRLIGIESSPAACDDFALNLDEFENIELYEDAAENVLPQLDVRANIVLVDPPRSGLEPAALDGILHMGPQTIIYVSCDPSTLARDARRLLNGGYILRASTPFDLFPQTYHIESISWFTKSGN